MEFNKIFASIILSLLIITSARIIAKSAFEVEPLEKNAYVVQGVEAAPGAEATAVKEAPLPDIKTLLAGASSENGEKISQKCAACHTLNKGGNTKVGPNLYGIVGNKKGHIDGFAYCQTIQDLHSKGETWSEEDLNHFLYSPRSFISGTKMGFTGLKDNKERADLIAYLKTLK